MLKKGTTKFSIINDGKDRVQRIYKNNNKIYEYLPEGYTDCEYIESTGTQYINTGLIGKSGYTLETSLSFTQLATGSYQYFAGHAYTGSADRLYFIRMANTTKALGYTYGADNTQTSNFTTLTENTWYRFKSIMKANEQKLYLDGTLLGGTSFGALSYDAQNPKYIYMFVSQYVSTVNGYTKAKCRYAKWYDENNNLVRHFVPCLDDNGVACMYDLVTKTTFYNQGTGDFKYKLAVLPLNYKQCNYIESTSGQYIDTGLKMNQNSGFEIKFLTKDEVSITANKYGCIFGARQSSGVKEFQLSTYKQNNDTIFRVSTSTYKSNITPNTIMISSPEELDENCIANAERIGITGATSTPRWLMEAVAAEVRRKLPECLNV